MACSNPWNSVFQVGSHHLAREFLKIGHEVAFISDPISPLHLIQSAELKKRMKLYLSGGKNEGRLWTYVPAALFTPHNKPLLRSSWLYRHWHQLTAPSIIKKAHKNGFGSVDLLYFDTPIQSFWTEVIEARRTVFRVADRNMGFRKASPALLLQEQKLIETVDHVVCSAKTLTDQIPGSSHLPNGVHVSHFSNKTPFPDELRNIPKPIAVYVGAIDYWFDFELIKELAQRLPNVSFVLIGPIRENPFKNVKNIYCLGPKDYSSIPSFLHASDVGIIPFDVKNYPELIHHVNPLKLYEYMACSLPVVATRWDELGRLNSPALLANSRDEFAEGILNSLRSPRDGLRAYAKKQDWSLRARELIALLNFD